MQDYTGMFEKVASDIATLVTKEASPEEIFDRYNTAGKMAIDRQARSASHRLTSHGAIRQVSRNSNYANFKATAGRAVTNAMAAISSPTHKTMAASERITRNRLSPIVPSKVNSFRNPVFAATNASSVPSLGGIAVNVAKRRFFK